MGRLNMKKYVFALIKSEDKVLMLKRPGEKKVYAGYWNFPGGKSEGNESEIETVIREVKEETGLLFRPITKIMDIEDEEIEPKKIVVFIGDSEGQVLINSEHERYAWLTVREINYLPVLPYIKKIFEGVL